MDDRSSFGTVDTGKVYFRIRADERNGGQVPDWDTPYEYRVETVPGSNPPIVYRELVSVGASTVTWRLMFDCAEDVQAFRAKLGETDTLTVPSTIQSHTGTLIPGEHVPFVQLLYTTAMPAGRGAKEIDGDYEFDVTFIRVVNPATGEAIAP